tara:strand:+ start:2336 stop:2704 length:369 start_codon:yes stop_codon:yes gene_type:complete
MKKVLILFFVFISCQKNEKLDLLDYKEFKKQVENTNVQLFDVRTPEEYIIGHIEGAINVDFKNDEVFDSFFNDLNKSDTIYLYCRSGNRSKRSADKLISLGFQKIYDLDGGFIEWNLNELKN